MTREFLASFFCVLSFATTAQAQMSDVPDFDANGDFHSAKVWGNRGYYSHWQWLVVESDAAGLNCRNANGNVILTLAYGAIIDSAFDNGDAIQQINGQPWLNVKVNTVDLHRQSLNNFAAVQTCYVRANNRYIAPILQTAEECRVSEVDFSRLRPDYVRDSSDQSGIDGGLIG